MTGLILNEEGYVTYPYIILKTIESYVRNLNWRVSNVYCGGRDSYTFPFEDQEETYIDGNGLFELLEAHSDIQWIWGVLSGFPKDIPYENIKKVPPFDLTEEQPYLRDRLHHIMPDAIIELIAFDSTESYMLIDDIAIVEKIKKNFPKSVSLEKYVY